MIRIAATFLICCSTLSAHAEITCTMPMADWQPVAKLLVVAKGMGWTAQRIRVDEGCYQLRATDQAGKFVVAVFDPVTLKLLGTSGADDDKGHEIKGDHN
ncbi:MAG: PepSY domain-containing protein [Paracoccaceae bacterium]